MQDENTADLLLKSARVLFSQKGFDATSVKELADAAGVNVSLVSYHFGGKLGLYRACIAQFGKERLAVAQKILEPAKTKDEFVVRLRMFVQEMVDCHLEDPHVVKIIHRECELDLPTIEDIFQETFLQVFKTLSEFLKRAQESGWLHQKADPLTSTALVFGSLVHFIKTDGIREKFFGLSLKDPAHKKNVIDQLMLTFLEGLLK